jgi:hypothetical protein
MVSVLPGQLRTLEFNLSQLRSVADLQTRFHEVRDVTLRGDLPLVFWDEFDAPFGGSTLGWLAHFLAPMQDGRFHEGARSHPIGPAIFVFAAAVRRASKSSSAAMIDEPSGPPRNPIS